MEVKFSPEQEHQLGLVARKIGLTTEKLVRNAALKLLEEKDRANTVAAEFPALRLGAMRPLHRRDIYDDAG